MNVTKTSVVTQESPTPSIDLSRTAFFSGAKPEVVKSPHEFLHLMISRPEDLLRAMRIPQKNWPELIPFVLQQEAFHEAFSFIAAAERFRIPYNRAPKFFAEMDDKQRSQVWTITQLSESLFRQELAPRSAAASLNGELWKGSPPRLFPFECMVVPLTMTNTVYKGSEGTMKRFALYVPERDREQIDRAISGPVKEVVENALCSLSFYRKGSGFTIVQITNQIGELNDAELATKYKDRMKVLLLAFECYVLSEAVKKAKDHPGGFQILAPSPETIAARWRKHVRRRSRVTEETRDQYITDDEGRLCFQYIKNEEVEAHFETLLTALGYQRGPCPAELVLEKNLAEEPIACEWAYAKAIRPEPKTTEELRVSELAQRMRSVSPKRLKELLKRKREMLSWDWIQHISVFGFPLSHSIDRGCRLFDINNFASVTSGFEFAPVHPIEADRIGGFSKELRQLHSKMLTNTGIAPVLQAMRADFTQVSKGLGKGISSDWRVVAGGKSPGWYMQPLHVAHQERHPSLRFIQRDEEGSVVSFLAVGIKGGGLRDENVSFLRKPPKDVREFRHPIYRRRRVGYGGGAHRYWGGLLMAEGGIEMVNSLGLLRLAECVKPAWPPVAAVPLDLAAFQMLPRWKDDKTHWVLATKHAIDVLGIDGLTFQQSLGTLRTISNSDVRVSTVVNSIFSAEGDGARGQTALENGIRESLRFVYLTNGEDIVLPSHGIRAPHATVRQSDILEYLREIYTLNQDAADTIYKRRERLWATLGAVHGAGGHLGGTSHSGIGATSGGAVTIRNVDTAWQLHDLDGNARIPGVHRSDLDLASEVRNRTEHAVMRWWDALYLADTDYWFETLLRGREVDPNQRLNHFQLSKSDMISRFGNREEYLAKSMRPPFQTVEEAEQRILAVIPDDEMREVYCAAKERGREFAANLEDS